MQMQLRVLSGPSLELSRPAAAESWRLTHCGAHTHAVQPTPPLPTTVPTNGGQLVTPAARAGKESGPSEEKH